MSIDGQIDYSTYTYRELLEALNNINANRFPQNYRNIQVALEKIGPVQRSSLEPEPQDIDQPLEEVPAQSNDVDPDIQHVKHILTALIVAALSAHLLWVGDITLPFAKPLVIALSGVGVYVGLASFCLAVSVPVSLLVDYFDTRDNAKSYRLYVIFAEGAATALLVFAYLWSDKA